MGQRLKRKVSSEVNSRTLGQKTAISTSGWLLGSVGILLLLDGLEGGWGAILMTICGNDKKLVMLIVADSSWYLKPINEPWLRIGAHSSWLIVDTLPRLLDTISQNNPSKSHLYQTKWTMTPVKKLSWNKTTAISNGKLMFHNSQKYKLTVKPHSHPIQPH